MKAQKQKSRAKQREWLERNENKPKYATRSNTSSSRAKQNRQWKHNTLLEVEQ